MLPDLVQSVFAFVNKPKLFKTHIQNGDLTHFPTLLKVSGQLVLPWISKEPDMQHWLKICKKALWSGSVIYNWKGHRLHSLSTHLMLRRKALLVMDEAAAELEMIDLCEEDQLKPALRVGTIDFWKLVPVLHLRYCQCLSASLYFLTWNIDLFSLTPMWKHCFEWQQRNTSQIWIVQGKECQKSP